VLFPNIRLLRDIAQLRSVSRAAAASGISQSAASQQMQEMERRLGIALFDRATRPLTLTPAGKLFHGLCRDVARREEKFQIELEKLTGVVEGSVRVASIYSVGLSEMSQIQEQFTANFPSAQLHVDYMRPEKVYEAVLADQADLGLVSYPERTRDLAVIRWREEEMAVAAPPSHPFAKRRALKPADLGGEQFVGFDEELPIRRAQDRFFKEQGIEIRLNAQFDNIQMMKEAVAQGLGLAILPARIMQDEIEQGRLVAIRLDAPGLVRPVGIVHRKHKRFNRAAKSFLAILQEKHVSQRRRVRRENHE
jgi:LysR family transcriptional regulator, transcriptional activator of the cysJI operon